MIENIESFLVLLDYGQITVEEIISINGGLIHAPNSVALLQSWLKDGKLPPESYTKLTGLTPVTEEIHIWIGDDHVAANQALASLRGAQPATGQSEKAAVTVEQVRQKVVEAKRYQSISERMNRSPARMSTPPVVLGVALALFVLAVIGIAYREKIQAMLDANPGSAANVLIRAGAPTETREASPVNDMLPSGTPRPSSTGVVTKEATIHIEWTDGADGAEVVLIGDYYPSCIPIWSSPLPSWPFDKATIEKMIVQERKACINAKDAQIKGWYGPSDWVLVAEGWTTLSVLGVTPDEVKTTAGTKDYMAAAGNAAPAPVPEAPNQSVEPTPAPTAFVCDSSTYSVVVSNLTGYSVGCDEALLLASNPGMSVVARGHDAVVAFLEARAAPPTVEATLVPTERPNIGADGEVCNVGNALYKHYMTDSDTGVVGFGYSCISDGAAWDMAERNLKEELAKRKREDRGG